MVIVKKEGQTKVHKTISSLQCKHVATSSIGHTEQGSTIYTSKIHKTQRPKDMRSQQDGLGWVRDTPHQRRV
jgi:hypothetical protein